VNAQEAGMSMPEYLDFIYKSISADLSDPVAAWQQVMHEGQRIVAGLLGRQHYHLRGPDID
jgi:hypothetical protein